MIPSAYTYFQPTNEAFEENYIKRTVEKLNREKKYILVRIGWPDPDRAGNVKGFTHYYFPDYEFLSDAEIMPIAEWLQHPRYEIPAYFYMGMRCYASFLPEDMATANGMNLHPSCKKMQDDFQLSPVFQENAINRGNIWINYYGSAAYLPVGLFKIENKLPDKRK